MPVATERKTRRKALQMMAKADGVPRDEKGDSEMRKADLFKKTGGYRKSVRDAQDTQVRGRERRTDRAYDRQDAGREGVEDKVRIRTAEDRFRTKYEPELHGRDKQRRFDPELLRVARTRKRAKR